jgi:presenilin-like A22 family membrane protease
MTSNALSSADHQISRATGAPSNAKRQTAAWLLAETLFVFASTFAVAVAAVRGNFAAMATPHIETNAAAVWSFLVAFAAATALVLILLHRPATTRLFEVIFLLAVFTGIGSLLFSLAGTAVAIIGTALAVLLYYKGRTVALFDVLLMTGSAGIAANLGASMQPTGIAIILAVLAIYDIIAVYVTRHMVAMAEGLLRRKVFFAMILPERPAGLLLPASEARPGAGFMFLGTGDLVLPALLVASVARTGLGAAAFVAAGALVGVAVMHVVFLSQKERRAMPALPPIVAGALVGFLVSLMI